MADTKKKKGKAKKDPNKQPSDTKGGKTVEKKKNGSKESKKKK